MDYFDIKNPETLPDISNKDRKYKFIIKILLLFLLILLVLTIIFIALYIKEKNKTEDAEDEPKKEETLYKPNENQYIEILRGVDIEGDEGAKEYQGKHDILNSKYFHSYDFYNMKSSGSLILLEKFKTYQQTTSYTCGCAALIMAIYYLDKEPIGEKDCVDIAKESPEESIKKY